MKHLRPRLLVLSGILSCGLALAAAPDFVLQVEGVAGAINRDFRTSLAGWPLYPGASEKGVFLWGSELYWIVPDSLPAGAYTLGLRHGGASRHHPGAYAFYINDRLGFFATSTIPKLMGGPIGEPPWGAECWLAEQYSQEQWQLKPGDMIRLLSTESPAIVDALLLFREPVSAPVRLLVPPVPFKMYRHLRDVERWQVTLTTQPPASPGADAIIKFTVRNVSGRALALKRTTWATDFYQRLVVPHAEAEVRLGNLESAAGAIVVPTGDQPHYEASLQVSDADGVTQTYVRDILCDTVRGERRTTRLDGEWQWQFQPGVALAANPPEGGTWEPTQVPPRMWTLNPWHEKYCGWYRRGFRAPEVPAGTRQYLHFERVDYECRIYLNGAEVGAHVGGYFPFDVEVTGKVKPGENTLLVGVRNWIAALAPEFLERADAAEVLKTALAPGGNQSDIWKYRIRVVDFAAPQDHSAYWAGHGGIEHAVWIETRPAVQVADVFVKPSVRAQTVTAEVSVHNTGDRETRVSVAPRLLRAGKTVRDLPAGELALSPGKSETLTFTTPARELEFWEPGHPTLYTLETRLQPSGTDRAGLADVTRTRFGYRELWVDGDRFILNLKPIKLRSAWPAGSSRSTWDQVRERMPEHLERGEVGFRTHLSPGVPSLVYDIADEMGMLGKPEACVNQGDSWKDPRFWENYLEHLRQMVRRQRHNPSVYSWSGHNEWSWHYSPDEMMARFYPAIQEIKRLDPTRLAEFEAGGDQRGRMEYFSWHYPNDYWAPLKGQPWMEECRRGKSYKVADYQVTAGTKPDSAGEMCWGSGIHLTGYTQYLGDDVYGLGSLGNEAGSLAYSVHGIRQLRDLEYANVHPWDYGNYLVNESFRPVCAVPRDWDGAFAGGQTITRRFNLHHDLLQRGKVKVGWQLVVGGQPKASGGQTHEMAPAELKRLEWRVALPAVVEHTAATLRVTAEAAGEKPTVVDSPLSIFPPVQIKLPTGMRFGLFDPEGQTAKLFAGLGLQTQSVPEPSATVLAALDALVIGRHAAADGKLVGRCLEISEFVKRGGTVLVLEQEKEFAWLPLSLSVDASRVAAINFPRALDHPLLAGLGELDLRYWRGDLLTSRRDYVKPQAGNFVVVVDGPGQGGLEWSPLVEVPHGKGRYVCCQLLVSEKHATDPAAATLLANLLRYPAQPAYRTLGKFGVIAAAGHPLRAFLDYLSLKYIALPAGLGGVNLSEFRVVLMDGSLDPVPAAPTLRSFVAGGGNLIAHRIPESRQAAWEQVLGVKLEAVARPDTALMKIAARDPFWGGISQHDMFWYGFTAYFNANGDQLGKIVERELRLPTAFDRYPEGAADGPLTMPAALFRLHQGKGQFILDQTCWDTPGLLEKLPGKAPRLVSQLITNLGGSFGAEVAPPRAITDYTPVPLAPYANRTFADEAEDDGKGGWTDQGRNDLRAFPTGRVTLGGVPFDIPVAGNTCIILRSDADRPINRIVPDAVRGIKVGKPADFIFFLHAGAWGGAGSRQFDYAVHYDDGTEELIPVVGGDNTGDWWNPDTPLRWARAVWTGKNDVRDPIGMFLFRWTNRYPEKAIRELDVVGLKAGAAVPMVVGITLGHAGEAALQVREYQVLDLSGVANKYLVDEKPGDGTGGWLDRDQDDLRELRTGNVRLAGIPFNVDPVRGCVTLKSRHHPQNPARVEGIAVGGKVSRLYFLHGALAATLVPGGAVGGMTVADYVIHYADGSAERFPVVLDRNVRHFADAPADTPQAPVAWTGRNPVRERVSLYAAVWANPFPAKGVATLQIVSTDREGTLSVIAVTAATDGPQRQVENRLGNPGVEAVRPLEQSDREQWVQSRATTFDGPAVFPKDWDVSSHNPENKPRQVGVSRDAHSGERSLSVRSEGPVSVSAALNPVPTGAGRVYRLGVFAKGVGDVSLNAGERPAPGREGWGFAHLSDGRAGPDWQAFTGRYVQCSREMRHWGKVQDEWQAAAISMSLELRGDLRLDDAFLYEEPVREQAPDEDGRYVYEVVSGKLAEAPGKNPLAVHRGFMRPDDLGLWAEAGDTAELALRMPAGRYALSLPVLQNHGLGWHGAGPKGAMPGVSAEVTVNGQMVALEFVGPLRLIVPHPEAAYGTYCQELQSAALDLAPGDVVVVRSLGWGAFGAVTLTPASR